MKQILQIDVKLNNSPRVLPETEEENQSCKKSSIHGGVVDSHVAERRDRGSVELQCSINLTDPDGSIELRKAMAEHVDRNFSLNGKGVSRAMR